MSKTASKSRIPASATPAAKSGSNKNAGAQGARSSSASVSGPLDSELLRKMDAWVNEKCGPSDASGIQGFVHETDDHGSNWKVHIFCRIEHSNKIKWTSKNNRGMQEPGNLKDMLRAIQAGDLAIVGNVRGLNNTTILVLEKDQQEP